MKKKYSKPVIKYEKLNKCDVLQDSQQDNSQNSVNSLRQSLASSILDGSLFSDE